MIFWFQIIFNLKRTILLSIAALLLVADVSGQVDRSGFTFGIGVGSGFSKHAGSYSVLKDPVFGIIDEYSGFRILAADLKVGWGISPRTRVYYTLIYTPPNTTISPYQSFYQGVALAYSPKSLEELIISLGAGVNKARDGDKKLGQGTMINMALGYEFNPHAILELNTIFGKMENTPPPLASFSTSSEFAFFITINYLFYRDPGE